MRPRVIGRWSKSGQTKRTICIGEATVELTRGGHGRFAPANSGGVLQHRDLSGGRGCAGGICMLHARDDNPYSDNAG